MIQNWAVFFLKGRGYLLLETLAVALIIWIALSFIDTENIVLISIMVSVLTRVLYKIIPRGIE